MLTTSTSNNSVAKEICRGDCILYLCFVSVCVCFSSPNISDQRVSISKLVRINEGRTARLKCYTQNVPNVTVSVFQLSSNIDNSMLNRVHFSIQSNFNLWVVWHGVLF